MRIACIALLTVACSAHADCYFKITGAPVCSSGSMAAAAYAHYGMDTNALYKDYTRALLHESGCGEPYYGGPGKNKIRLLQAGRVPTPNGWIAVDSVSVNDTDLGFIAAEYIAGKCEKYVPAVIQAKPDQSTCGLPGMAKCE